MTVGHRGSEQSSGKKVRTLDTTRNCQNWYRVENMWRRLERKTRGRQQGPFKCKVLAGL